MKFLMVLLLIFSFAAKVFCCEELSVDHKETSVVSESSSSPTSDSHAHEDGSDHHCEIHCLHSTALPEVHSVVLKVPALIAPVCLYSFNYAEPGVDLLKRPPVLV